MGDSKKGYACTICTVFATKKLLGLGINQLLARLIVSADIWHFGVFDTDLFNNRSTHNWFIFTHYVFAAVCLFGYNKITHQTKIMLRCNFAQHIACFTSNDAQCVVLTE